MSAKTGGGAVTTSKGTKQPSGRVDDDLDVDSLLAEFANLKFTIQKGTATETNVGRARQLHKILASIDNELTVQNAALLRSHAARTPPRANG